MLINLGSGMIVQGNVTYNPVVLPQKRLLIIGDSTTYGRGASTAHSAGVVNAHAGSPARILASALSANGIKADSHSVVGMGNNSGEATTAEYFDATADIDITLNGWDNLEYDSIGGDLFRNGTSNETLIFTFDNVDRAAIGLPIRTYGDIRYRIDSGSWITVSETGTDDLLRIEIDFGSLGSHTIEFERLTSTVYVSYVEAWDSSSDVVIIPWGARGYNAAQLNDTTRPWSYKSALSYVPFDAVIINIGINDVKSSASTTETSYTNDLEAYIQAVQAENSEADIFLQIPNDIDGGLDYVPSVLATLSGTYGCTILDSRLAPDMSDFATADAAGKMFDDLHPSATGYAAEWNYFQPIIQGVLFGS